MLCVIIVDFIKEEKPEIEPAYSHIRRQYYKNNLQKTTFFLSPPKQIAGHFTEFSVCDSAQNNGQL